MSLFPEATDDARRGFLAGLVAIASELDYSIYRIGYRKNRHKLTSDGDEREVLSICFQSIQFCLQLDEPDAIVWPIMELDRAHNRQDLNFSGAVQRLDWYSSIVGKDMMSIDNAKLGEALYHSKRSAYGAMTDCFSYLLHLRFRRDLGDHLTSFKQQLVDIADGLAPILKRNEVIDLGWGQPPASYISDGPIRWAVPISPKD